MGLENDESLLKMYFGVFREYVAEYKKHKELEDAVKVQELKIQDFIARQKSSAQSVMSKLKQGTDAGLLQDAFKNWEELVREEKQRLAQEEALAARTSKMTIFNVRNKGSAIQECKRQQHALDQHLLLSIVCHWDRMAKTDRMIRWAKERNLKRKQQLIGVKGLFKNFADELETGLKAGTPRLEDVRR